MKYQEYRTKLNEIDEIDEIDAKLLSDKLSTGILKDFDSRTEVMGLNCPYGNAEGIKFNDLVSRGQPLVRVGGLSLAV